MASEQARQAHWKAGGRRAVHISHRENFMTDSLRKLLYRLRSNLQNLSCFLGLLSPEMETRTKHRTTIFSYDIVSKRILSRLAVLRISPQRLAYDVANVACGRQPQCVAWRRLKSKVRSPAGRGTNYRKAP